jgi:hypothetical protein
MGLDMFAYSIKKEDVVELKDINPVFVEGLDKNQLFYWRKYHDLHGWMKKLYYKKGGTEEFNCDYVMLTLEDLEDLEKDVREGNLPNTEGFFFGNNPPDSKSIENDIDFIYAAKRAIGDGLYVFYTSWW